MVPSYVLFILPLALVYHTRPFSQNVEPPLQCCEYIEPRVCLGSEVAQRRCILWLSEALAQDLILTSEGPRSSTRACPRSLGTGINSQSSRPRSECLLRLFVREVEIVEMLSILRVLYPSFAPPVENDDASNRHSIAYALTGIRNTSLSIDRIPAQRLTELNTPCKHNQFVVFKILERK